MPCRRRPRPLLLVGIALVCWVPTVCSQDTQGLHHSDNPAAAGVTPLNAARDVALDAGAGVEHVPSVPPLRLYPRPDSTVGSGRRVPLHALVTVAALQAAGEHPTICWSLDAEIDAAVSATMHPSSCTRANNTRRVSLPNDLLHGLTPGRHNLSISIRPTHASPPVAVGTSSFNAWPMAACRFGQAPCMTPAAAKPWCREASTFRFFLYPGAAPPSVPQSGPAALFFHVLRGHPARTDSPAEACVFVPNVDTLCVHNMCTAADGQLAAALSDLPYWNNGRDHVVFNWKDHELMADVGYAMVAKSSFGPAVDTAALARHLNIPDAPNFEQERAGYDVVLPLSFYRCGFDHDVHLVRFGNTQDVPPVQARRVLLSFKGARHDLPPAHPAYPRNLLRFIHNGDDVVMATYCTFLTVDCRTNATSSMSTSFSRAFMADCRNDTAYSREQPFDDLLLHSQFTIVAPGEGTHSYRLLEALAAGSIPVVLGDAAVPFPGLLPWSHMAVVQRDVSLSAVLQLPASLRRIPMRQRWRMQQAGLRAFHTSLHSLRAHVDTALRVLQRRFSGVMGLAPPCSVARAQWTLFDATAAPCVHDTLTYQQLLRRLPAVAATGLEAARALAMDVAVEAAAQAQVATSNGWFTAAVAASQTAVLWAAWVVHAVGVQPFTNRGLTWGGFVDGHAAVMAAATSSWQGVEPPPPATATAPTLPDGSPADIGVVTLCAYDASVSPLAAMSARRGVTYCKRHGCTLYFEGHTLDAGRPTAWSKLAAVKKYLSHHAWVMWMDCDSFFMNASMPLSAVLAAGMQAAPDPADVHLVLARDGLMENTGVFFLRSHSWSHTLLDEAYDAFGGLLVQHPWWEQAVLHHLLWDDAAASARRRHVQFAPQSWFNSYPGAFGALLHAPGNASRPLHAVYQPGDFIASFSGCTILLQSNQACVELMRQFTTAAEAQLADA